MIMTLDGSCTADVAALIRAVEQASSPGALLAAVRSLAAAQAESAIPTLIQVLGYNNPGAAVAAVEGLVTLGARAVPVILGQIDGYNYGARAWAIRALARIGHPDALDTLVDAALQDFSLSVRRAAMKGLGSLQWQVLSPDQQRSAQEQVLATLVQGREDPEWVVRYAAIAGLQALVAALDPREAMVITARQTLEFLATNDDTLTVRARAILALSAIAVPA
jgi:phycocyanobilin lyase beta subunit